MSTVTSVLDETTPAHADNEGNQPQEISAVAADQQQQVERYLDGFVGQDKPYKSVEEAAEALAKKAVNADSFIETLKKEKQELEQRVVESKTIDDVLKTLNAEQEPATPAEAPESTPDLQSQFKEFLSQYEQEKVQAKQEEEQLAKMQQNQSKFWELGSGAEGFGSKEGVVAAIKRVVEDGKMTREEIDADGNTNPEKLLVTLKHFAGGTSDPVQYSTDDKTKAPPEVDLKNMGALTMDKIDQFEKQNREKLKTDRNFHFEWTRYKHANYKPT